MIIKVKQMVMRAVPVVVPMIVAAWCPVPSATEISGKQSSEQDGLRQISSEERMKYEPVLTGLVQRRIDAERRLKGQAPIVAANVAFHPSGNAMVVELGRAYLPSYYSIDFEELIQRICDELVDYIEPVSPIRHVEVLFEGRDIFEYFPEELGEQEKNSRKSGAVLLKRNDAGKGRVLVAAGHGIYFDTASKEMDRSAGSR